MRQEFFNNYYKQTPGFINKYKHSKERNGRCENGISRSEKKLLNVNNS